MTKKTAMVLDIINSSKYHPTAEEIFFSLKNAKKSISLATVYNSLNILVKNGLIKKLSFDGKSDRFDNIKPHDHLVCIKCGKITDVFSDDLTDKFKALTKQDIISYDINIFYTCESCRESV